MTKREKFSSHKIGKYSEEYIVQLRKDVIRTCNYLSPNVHFDFEASRQSISYRELSDLLYDKDYPELSYGTLHNFFTNESKVSANGDRYFSFQEKTINILQDFVDKYQPPTNQLSSQNVNYALDSNNIEMPILDEKIKKILYQGFMQMKGLISAKEEITVDEKGNCIIAVKRYQEAHTDISHILTEIFVDKPGKIKVVEATDSDVKEKLEAYTYKEDELSHSFFLIFPEIKKSEYSFNYSFVLSVENYFGFLLEKGQCIIERMPFVFRYKSLNETYLFPNTPVFESLKVVIKNHPNAELMEMEIKPVIEGNYKHYNVDNGNLIHFDTPIVLQFTLR